MHKSLCICETSENTSMIAHYPKHYFTRLALTGCVLVFLSACAGRDHNEITTKIQAVDFDVLIRDGRRSLTKPKILETIQALQSGELERAQTGFNHLLKLDPSNSQLHFLNGLTYHLRAERGDTSLLPLAAIGYQLAIQHDSSNYWASFQLGHIYFNERRYRRAQEAFAYAWLLAPEEQYLTGALAVASYYARDLKTAYQMMKIEKSKGKIYEKTDFLQNAIIIESASGNFDAAQADLEKFRSIEGYGHQSKHIARRMSEWWQLYNQKTELPQKIDFLTSDATDTNNGTSIDGITDSLDGIKNVSDPITDTSKAYDNITRSTDNTKTKDDQNEKPQMTMVDVVIIRSTETKISGKGVNLLSGLTATLAGTSFAFNSARTVNDTGTGNNTRINSFTYAPTLSVAATYSLNIFNDNYDHNEVLARPSLLAIDGKKSEFFTGSVFYVELSGTDTGTVQNVPVGIRLVVTPKFNKDGTVDLSVEAARDFITARSSYANFSNFAQVTKTLITANVNMTFDDTVVIGGLSTKGKGVYRDGVPLLQNIPGIQYLFSREDSQEITKSILILLTPRKARYVYGDGAPKAKTSVTPEKNTPQHNVKEVHTRLNKIEYPSNIDSIFNSLNASSAYNEFRTGDLKIENWTDTGLVKRIQRALEFLYY